MPAIKTRRGARVAQARQQGGPQSGRSSPSRIGAAPQHDRPRRDRDDDPDARPRTGAQPRARRERRDAVRGWSLMARQRPAQSSRNVGQRWPDLSLAPLHGLRQARVPCHSARSASQRPRPSCGTCSRTWSAGRGSRPRRSSRHRARGKSRRSTQYAEQWWTARWVCSSQPRRKQDYRWRLETST